MKKLTAILCFLIFSFSACAQIQGLGFGTLTCVDRDNDGYGVGPGCLGLDADDQDASVQTAAQGISKYGTLAAFIAHLGQEVAQDSAGLDSGGIAAGYGSPNHTWFLAPAGSGGSDSNNCTSVGTPCLTISRLVTQGFVGGDLVIARQAWNGALSLFSGSASKYTVFISYPGEQAILTGAGGNSADLTDTNHVVIDGLKVQNFSQISGGTTDGAGTNRFNHVMIRHVDGGSGGTSIGAVDLFNGLSYLDVEDSVFHDNSCGGGSCQHGMYNGSRELASDHVTYRRLIAYGNDYNGLTFNGRCTACAFSQLISYNNLISGVTFEEGVSSSTIGPILSFNNSKQINIYDYEGQGFIDAGGGSATVNTSGTAVTWVSSADGGTFTSGAVPGGTGISINCQWYSVASVTDAHHLVLNQSAGTQTGVVYYQAPPICPYDQTGNVIENVTLYSTQHLADGTDNTNGSAFQITNANPGAGQNLGGNTYRNIVAVDWGNNNHYSPITYTDCNATGNGLGCGIDGALCASACQGWLNHDTYDHVVYFQSDGSNGNGLIGACTNPACNSFGFASYTCAQATAAFGTTASNCTNANPKFMQADPSYWNAVNLFNFRLQTTSSALNAGTTTGLPPFDVYGVPFMATPSMGAIESRVLLANGWTDTGTKLLTSMCPADGFAGSVNAAGAPYTYSAFCHTVTDAWSGGFQETGSQYLHAAYDWGGGHSDYAGNEFYRTFYSIAAPSSSKINNPDLFTQADWGAPDHEEVPTPSGTNANTRHTGNGEHLIPWLHKMMIYSGALAGNGGHLNGSWMFDLSSLSWTRLDPVDCTDHGFGAGCDTLAGHPTDPSTYNTGQFEGKVIPDPSTQTVFVIAWDSGGQTITQYFPSFNQYILRVIYQCPCPALGIGGPADTDLLVNNGTSKFILEWGRGKAIKIDVSDVSSITITDITANIDSSCGPLLTGIFSPGMAYDINTGKIIGKPINDAHAYIVDFTSNPSLWTCTTGPGGGPTNNPGAGDVGIYGRMAYDPDLDAVELDEGFGVDYYLLSLNSRGSASAVRKVNGDSQGGSVNSQLPVLLTVQVTDSSGVPIPNSTVTWAVTAGGGSLSAASATTDSYGTASTSLTLGGTPGTNTVTATAAGLAGSPITFNATGTVVSGSTRGSSVVSSGSSITN